jgi:energy-coupling factor transporter ATP-binding protein EcfA2
VIFLGHKGSGKSALIQHLKGIQIDETLQQTSGIDYSILKKDNKVWITI